MCRVCGAHLSSYNSNTLCSPCQKKQKDLVEKKLEYSAGYRLDYLYGVLEGTGRRRLELTPNIKIHI